MNDVLPSVAPISDTYTLNEIHLHMEAQYGNLCLSMQQEFKIGRKAWWMPLHWANPTEL
jgi:hypothetical protein